MIKKLLLILLCLPMIGFGQTEQIRISFDDFKYIKIESNDWSHDIISIATSIFSQKGFIVINEEEKTPKDAVSNPCLVLKSTIKFKRGVVGWTPSTLNLKFIDCNDKILFEEKSWNTANFNQPDVSKCFQKATASIKPIASGKKKVTANTEWRGNGSGFFISKSGYIVTNNHVIDGASEIEVEFKYKNEIEGFNAKIIKVDKTNDLAIIKIDDSEFSNISTIPYNFKTRSVDIGTEIFALGYPMALSLMGKDIKFTDGKISSKTGFDGDITTYQIQVPIQPGNSGGPLFDFKGNLIGITSSTINRKLDLTENVNYAIKTSYLLNLIDVLPETIILPSSTQLASKKLTEQIKILSDFVVLIKVK